MFRFVIRGILCTALLVSCRTTTQQTGSLQTALAAEYIRLGDRYVEIERYDDAISCYERARGNKTLRNDARYKIARTYALAENWDAAYAAFTALRTHDEDNAALKASCAYVTAMSGRTDEALRQYKALVEQYPYDESLLANYITLLLSDGRAERAEPEVARFKETFPDSTAYDTLERTLSALLDAEAAH